VNVGWFVLSAALLLPGGSSAQAPRIVMMASTIGPIDAGIVAALEDAFFRRTGIVVRHAGAGTGAALEMAKTGSFDLVMVHARALEDKFVADGFGIDRRDVMYNDFVILGPPSDPAGIRGQRGATAALRKIAAAQAAFVTRGDNSGTHVKESSFADWLVSDEAQDIIKQFGVDRYGAALFFPNSDQWRQKHRRG
jgi:tungstate transport system substrate-binding protein